MATYGPTAISRPAGAIIIHPGDNVSAIVNNAPAGATFFFEAGEYRGVSLSPKDGQTFIGQQGAVLNGSNLLTNFTQEGSHWVIGGQTQEGSRSATDQGEPGSMRAGYPDTVYIDNKPLTPVDALSKLAPGKFYFDYAADKIYIGDNPAGHKVEAGTLDHAFEGNANGVTVKNFVVEKYSSPVQTGAIEGNQSWTIIDNEVRLNYGAGMRADANSKMVGNFIHDNGQMGIGDYDHVKTNLLVEGNEIARNGWWSGIEPMWEGGGTKFKYTDGLVVRGNYSHDNHGMGLWTDINNINTTYENNIVIHNDDGGISHEISYHAVIRNNVVMGNGYQSVGWMFGDQIQVQNSSNVEVYGNKVDMTGAQGGNAIGLIQQNRGSGNHGPWVTTGNNIHDNIIVSKDGNGIVGGAADFNAAGMLNGGNVWKNNAYYIPDGNHFWWGNTNGFAAFKAATGETGTLSQAYPNTDAWVTVSDTGTGTSPGNTGTDPGTTAGNSGSGATAGGTDPGSNGAPGTPTGDPGSGATAGGPDPGANGTPGTPTGNPGSGATAGSPDPNGNAGAPTGNPGTDTAGHATPQIHFVDGDHRANDLFGSSADDVMLALGGDDRLAGGDGDDHLLGGRGNDILFGGAGNDEIRGGDGRDIIKAGAGSDVIYGGDGSGKDVLLLSGTIKDYTIEFRGQSVRFTNAAGETDVVRGVERFHFDDGTTYVINKHALVQTNLGNGLDALLAKVDAWDTLQAQHPEVAQQTNAGLAEITQLDLATGATPAANPADPVPTSAAQSVDASAHVDPSIGLTAHDPHHDQHHII